MKGTEDAEAGQAQIPVTVSLAGVYYEPAGFKKQEKQSRGAKGREEGELLLNRYTVSVWVGENILEACYSCIPL